MLDWRLQEKEEAVFEEFKIFMTMAVADINRSVMDY